MSKVFEPVPFVKDRLVLFLVSVDGLMMLAIVLSVFLRLRSHDFKVPVQYVVNDGSVLQTSQWFTLYSLAFFAVFAGVGTIILAQRLHKSERNYSIIALVLFIVIGLFGLLVTNAILGLVSQV